MSAGLAPGTIPLPGATVTGGDCRCDVWALMGDDAVAGVAVMRDERDLVLTVVKPEKPVPAAVGGGKSDPPEGGVDDGGALDQPAVEPAPPADE